MRRLLLLATAFAMAAAPFAADAQSRRGGGDDQAKQEADAAAKKKKDQEWSDVQAPLPALRNAAPCPFVKTLYDAGRYVEFKDNREASANVGYTGEIQSISAGCQYKDAEPIRVALEILFEFGRGPQAQASSKTYHYWVAVTDRNREILAKQSFELPVNFASGQDRVYISDKVNQITIPRGDVTTSGANFEVLVGFDVTPQMAAFNRDGKRFRVNAGSTTVAAGDASTRR